MGQKKSEVVKASRADNTGLPLAVQLSEAGEALEEVAQRCGSVRLGGALSSLV